MSREVFTQSRKNYTVITVCRNTDDFRIEEVAYADQSADSSSWDTQHIGNFKESVSIFLAEIPDSQ